MMERRGRGRPIGAFSALTDEQAANVKRWRAEGKTWAWIGAKMGKSGDAIRVRLEYRKKRLRQ